MARKTPNNHCIRTPGQVRALASPVRQEIVDALAATGPSPIAEIGRILGRPADALYFHVRALCRAGLLMETERRKHGRHVFSVYDVAARPLGISYDAAPREDLARVLRAIVRLGGRDLERALKARTLPVRGSARRLWVGRVRSWMSDEDVRAVNRHLQGIIDRLQKRAPAKGRRLQTFTFVLAPAFPGRRGTAASKGEST